MAKASTQPMASSIRLNQVRTHNLKGFDLELPLRKLIVVTGVSGAGKSSLAFDTLYAEGQLRYIETFSAYARQFLEPLEKPDVERIESIPPAIAVAGRETMPATRATLGTMSETHGFLCILFARIGQVFCRECGRPVAPSTPRSVSQAVDELPEGTRYELAFPLEILPGSDPAALTRGLIEDGLTRAREGNRLIDLSTEVLPASTDGTSRVVDVLVDRLARGKDSPQRRLDSIETAFARGLGRCRLLWEGGTLTFVRGWRCGACGTDHIEPRPDLFRYTSALGACPQCEGVGQVMAIDLPKLVPDRSKSIREGAVAPWNQPSNRRAFQEAVRLLPQAGVAVNLPFDQLSSQAIQILIDGDPASGYPGLKRFLDKLDRKTWRQSSRSAPSHWRRPEPCPACRGARLRPEALAVRVEGLNIAELSALSVRVARATIDGWIGLRSNEVANRLLEQIGHRFDSLKQIGLDYLSLDRAGRSLSGGELRRVTMTRTLGAGLVNTLYVLDEPTIGLHDHEVGRLVQVLNRLRDAGNTVVVVEHDRAVIEVADQIVDLGPGAGEAGGQLLYAGPYPSFFQQDGSPTSDFQSGRRRIAIPTKRRSPTNARVTLRGASGHNLKAIDVSFPLGLFCVVTGVSGAGKSTLVEQTLYPALRERLHDEASPTAAYQDLFGADLIQEAHFLDQSPLGRSGRTNPATALKAFDEIRRTFAATHEAKLRNYGAGIFSFNRDGGRCGTCKGDGYLEIDMQFLPDVRMRCPDCKGTRYRPEVLEITYRGRNIAEIMEMTAREAFGFFRNRPRIQSRLRPMLDIGLDYLRLGQPSVALSGGEAQRLKLAGFLGSSTASLNRIGNIAQTLFILDEPTAGLHPLDMIRLIEALNSLVDRGHSVIVIEHSPEIMASADWIIDLGPGAGDEGGRVVAEGSPEDVACSGTLTGDVLKRWLGAS